MADEDENYISAIRRLKPIDVLLHWVREREAVRVRKERGDAFPWTADPIIRSWRFCCVRREDDRVTKWIAENIRKPYTGHRHLWFMLCAARMINWPETIRDLMCTRTLDGEGWPDDPEFTPEKMGVVLEARARRLQKVFGGAYIIPAPHGGGNKGRFIAETVLGQLWRDRERFNAHFDGTRIGVRNPTLRNTHAFLSSYLYWGEFLAYQAVVDMRFTKLLSDAEDVGAWVACGPGTRRGLNRLQGRQLDRKIDDLTARNAVRELWPAVRAAVPCDLSDVPNVLCEFDKYTRVLRDEGEPKARYVPGRGS